MAMLKGDQDLISPLVHDNALPKLTSKSWFSGIFKISVAVLIAGATLVLLVYAINSQDEKRELVRGKGNNLRVEAEHGVVASDDERCSVVGVEVLKEGGHVVDSAVATALCLGVVNQASSGLGGGAFMVWRSSSNGQSQAFDMRETAPLKASKDMYAKDPSTKSKGPMSVGVPGELAGLHLAWTQHGRLAWKRLVHPAVDLAIEGFTISSFVAMALKERKNYILADKGLRQIFTREGKILEEGDICYNKILGETLQEISNTGTSSFYNGTIAKKLISDIQAAGGILSTEDLQTYKVKVTKPLEAQVMGYTILGMPPPSSGGLGLAFILNILASYGTKDVANGPVGLHRTIEALKHMFAQRMNLGDPDYVDITYTSSNMLSPEFALKIRERILDNTTFPPDYYQYKWSELKDHGTSHFAIVDKERNSLAMTSTVNSFFGSKMVSESTGILLNNEMDDFSTPTEVGLDKLPPSPSNFISPGKRPLSSMSPTIILKGQQVVAVLGASGGFRIIPAVAQVFINHFLKGMDPLLAVTAPRVFSRLVPDVVEYENFTALSGVDITFSKETCADLIKRGHKLRRLYEFETESSLVVQDLLKPVGPSSSSSSSSSLSSSSPSSSSSGNKQGMLTAVGDPRKNAIPAGY